jgi:arginyl-tRNA synthetase
VYLTADLAYHHDKFARGFDVMVDVFGADHAGHIGRIKAGMAALGHDLKKLNFVVVQMMRLIKDGQEIKFSKRTGQVVGLDDLIELVGKDVARFVFLMRSSNAQFDLDLDQVASKSSDNPVFYVQYGHARIATILAKAEREYGIKIDARGFDRNQQAMLTLPEERELVLCISELEDIVREAADALEPHRVIFYCQELVKTFHSYFTKYRHTEKIISDNEFKTKSRLSMIFAIKLTIFNALSFLGISAPEYMELHVEHDDDGKINA